MHRTRRPIGLPKDDADQNQAARARARMALLSDRDPPVKQCRGAIRQAIAMRKVMGFQSLWITG